MMGLGRFCFVVTGSPYENQAGLELREVHLLLLGLKVCTGTLGLFLFFYFLFLAILMGKSRLREALRAVKCVCVLCVCQVRGELSGSCFSPCLCQAGCLFFLLCCILQASRPTSFQVTLLSSPPTSSWCQITEQTTDFGFWDFWG